MKANGDAAPTSSTNPFGTDKTTIAAVDGTARSNMSAFPNPFGDPSGPSAAMLMQLLQSKTAL